MIKPIFPKIGKWELRDSGNGFQVCLWAGPFRSQLFCGYTNDSHAESVQNGIDEALRKYEEWRGTKARKKLERKALSKKWGVSVK